MPRTRIIPDETVFATLRRMMARGGDKAVSFSSVAMATGLAAPTLVQRYGTRDGMVLAALLDGWDRLDQATAAAIAGVEGKGAQGLLKALSADSTDPEDMLLLLQDLRTAALRDRASGWRESVERALATRLGDDEKGREGAAMVFAAWQGQILWAAAGGRGFRMKDAVKRLG